MGWDNEAGRGLDLITHPSATAKAEGEKEGKTPGLTGTSSSYTASSQGRWSHTCKLPETSMQQSWDTRGNATNPPMPGSVCGPAPARPWSQPAGWCGQRLLEGVLQLLAQSPRRCPPTSDPKASPGPRQKGSGPGKEAVSGSDCRGLADGFKNGSERGRAGPVAFSNTSCVTRVPPSAWRHLNYWGSITFDLTF